MDAVLPIATTGSSAREREAALIAHCVATSAGAAHADSVGLAHLHQLAASLLQERAPAAAARLRASAQAVLPTSDVSPSGFREESGVQGAALLRGGLIADPESADDVRTAPLSLTDLREQGWIVDLPRFRRQLFQALRLTC